MTKTKVCTKCERRKPRKLFYPRKGGPAADPHMSICRKCWSERSAANYQQNRDKLSQRHKDWRTRNAERYSAQQKEYYNANKDRILERHRKTRQSNLAKYRRIESESHKKNPQTWRDSRANRRARLKAAFVEPVKRRTVYNRDGGLCQICGDPVAFDDMHLEHRIPLARGGLHSYENTRTACARCNLAKGVKT